MEKADQSKETIFFSAALGVFQGGGCRAAAFGGAYEAAASRGVHIVEVAGTSAGSVVAALIGAGATAEQANTILRSMDFKKLLAPPQAVKTSSWDRFLSRGVHVIGWNGYGQILTHRGLYSTSQLQAWVARQLKDLLKDLLKEDRPVCFKDLVMPTSIIATDLQNRRVKVWSQLEEPNADVAFAVAASCAIPFFFQPVAGRYIDGGTLANLPAFVFANRAKPLAARILAFTLRAEAPVLPADPGIRQLVGAISSTIVDGSTELQLRIQDEVNLIDIPTGRIQATDFDKMNKDEVDRLIRNGASATNAFLDRELDNVRGQRSKADLHFEDDEIYSSVAQMLRLPVDDVLIAERDTSWLQDLFVALLFWRSKGVPVRILVNGQAAPRSPEADRRRLLTALGATVVETRNLSTRAYVLNGTKRDGATAIVRIDDPIAIAKKYEGLQDFGVIQLVRSKIEEQWRYSGAPSTAKPTLVRGDEDVLVTALRSVFQYTPAKVSIKVERIPLSAIKSLTKYVREFKYRQSAAMLDLYRDAGLEPFEFAVAQLNGMTTLVTPPILEKSGSEFVTIDGNSRILYCRDNHIDFVSCVVLDGVAQALPARTQPLKLVNVAGRLVERQARYDGLNSANWRHIERAIHPDCGTATRD